MESKEYILLFRSGAWQKVVCGGIKMYTIKCENDDTTKKELSSIEFEPCEGSTEPYFINASEIAGIFPSVKKNKEVKTVETEEEDITNLSTNQI